MAEQKQFCTFYLGDLCFGVEVLNVQEVFRFQEMTSVPLAPSVVRGLINLRGQIITAIDLRKRLNFDPLEEGKLPMNIVVRTDGCVVSLLVDEIGDVLEVSSDCYEPPPDTITGSTRELVDGVYKLKDRLLLILNADKAANVDRVESLQATV